MNNAVHYARALFALTGNSPAGETKEGETFVSNLFAVLKYRGHTKLSNRILSEYQKLALQKERAAMYAIVNPQQEQTRVLLELYQKLIATK